MIASLFTLAGAKQAAMHVLAMAVGYGLGVLFTEGTSHVLAFGAVCAWWSALYIGLLLVISLPAVPWLVILYEGLLLIDAMLNTGLFYEEGAWSAPAKYILLGQIGLIVFITPVAVNHVVRRLSARTRMDGVRHD